MGRLLILRHAKAEPLIRGSEDHARALAPRGHADANRLGRYLAAQKLVPSLAVVSDARRTQETWASLREGLESALGSAADAVQTRSEPRLYNATAVEIVTVIRELPDVPSVMLIAHNPGMHEIAARLTGGGDEDAWRRLSDGLPTCGLIVLDFAVPYAKVAANGGRIERFVTPEQLAADAR